MRAKPRKKFTAWASCGSHGKPFVTQICRREPENEGRFEIFERFEQARNAGGYTHKVTIYVDAEPAVKEFA